MKSVKCVKFLFDHHITRHCIITIIVFISNHFFQNTTYLGFKDNYQNYDRPTVKNYSLWISLFYAHTRSYCTAIVYYIIIKQP